MKRVKKYIVIIFIFIIIMISLFIFFIFRFNEIHLLNNARVLLKDLYTIDSGKYIFKAGVLFNNDGLISDKFYFDGNGEIIIDKYGNVKFMINSNDYCVSKTFLGNIVIDGNKCGEFVDIEVSLSINNNSVSFNVDNDKFEYLVSRNDDLVGEWKENEYSDNLVLKFYDDGKYYIWFKDSLGNLSNSYTFDINCFLSDKGEYENSLYYCSGSTIIIDDINYIVLNDNEYDITVLKQNPLEIKLSHCLTYEDEFCYYGLENKNIYKWSNSYINYYLNNEYISSLSHDIQNKLVDVVLCDDFVSSGCLNNEGCGGFTKKEIYDNKWSCNSYSKSKIRIMSYSEYANIYDSLVNKSLLRGNYWLISNGIEGLGSSVQFNSDVFVKEDFTSKLDVMPVFTFSK